MKRLLIAAAICLGSAGAFAQDADDQAWAKAQSQFNCATVDLSSEPRLPDSFPNQADIEKVTRDFMGYHLCNEASRLPPNASSTDKRAALERVTGQVPALTGRIMQIVFQDAAKKAFAPKPQSEPLKLSELSRCSVLDDSSERLACYDLPAGRKAPSAPAAEAPKPESKWEITEDKSKLDGSRSTRAVLPATEVNVGSSFGDVSAHLVIRCEEKKTSAYVVYGRTMVGHGNVQVSYRVGKSSPQSTKWPASQDMRAYGPFDTAPSVALVKALLAADDFFVRGETNLRTSEAYFKLDGIQEAVRPVRENCRW